jgi:hypothetical protein
MNPAAGRAADRVRMRARALRVLVACAVAVATAAQAAPKSATAPSAGIYGGGADQAGADVREHDVSRLSAPQVAYLTSCGGCHGVEGVSAPRDVPTLRHLTGSFLCTRRGRQFIVRLPDVALSTLSDRMLTAVLNWVVFDLGAPATRGPHGRLYTVAEVARLRREPLTQTGLTAYRNQVVAQLQARCDAPAALSVYGGGSGYGRPGVESPASPKS